MTNPPPPKSLTSTPTGPRIAELALATSGSGAPKDAARKGAPSALRFDPHPATVTGIHPGLTVRGMGRGAMPTADWLCACGEHEHARGRDAVAELTTQANVHACPHQQHATSEGRAAA